MILWGNTKRPFDLGPYPLERLPRDPKIIDTEAARPPIERPLVEPVQSNNPLSNSLEVYHEIYRGLGHVKSSWPKAPVPDSLERRTQDIKGAVYFLDASQCGICEIPVNAWCKNCLLYTSDAADE